MSSARAPDRTTLACYALGAVFAVGVGSTLVEVQPAAAAVPIARSAAVPITQSLIVAPQPAGPVQSAALTPNCTAAVDKLQWTAVHVRSGWVEGAASDIEVAAAVLAAECGWAYPQWLVVMTDPTADDLL